MALWASTISFAIWLTVGLTFTPVIAMVGMSLNGWSAHISAIMRDFNVLSSVRGKGGKA
jgi:hypothetical protein